MFCIYLLYWNALLMVILKKLKKEAGDVPFNVGQERTIPEKLCLCSWMEYILCSLGLSVMEC